VRLDDYKNALALAAKDLSGRNPSQLAKMAGTDFDGRTLTFVFFNRPVKVEIDGYSVKWADQTPPEEFPLTDAVLVLHYLQGANGLEPTGELVAYRQIPGGEFYTAAFRNRAELPILGTFGRKPGLLTKAAQAFGGSLRDGLGDEAAIFRVFPNMDILTMIHLGDEEFEAEGQVLFDKTVGLGLNIEDVAWLGSALVYRLMGAAKKLQSNPSKIVYS
jgi:hypothetical protein